MGINTDEIVGLMHETCGDTDFSKGECADAYEEVAYAAAASAAAIREEIEADGH